MANIFVFANLARSSLAGALGTTDVNLSVQAGGGAQFPNPLLGQQFALTLTDAATGLLKEIVYCTSKSGDTMTVVRGQEGYTALTWQPGDPIANLWTAGQAAAMLQSTQAQAQSANYAVDVGTTNAYVGNYSPSISVPTAGMPLRLKIANTNSGPSTFNPGSGLGPIVTGNGAQLSGGELQAGLVYEFMWNGASYELMGPNITNIPAGTIAAFAGSPIPAGWLACQGQSLLRSAYPDLFTSIGTAYGSVDGAHFTLPDIQGRVVAGLDPTNSRLTSPYVGPNGNTLGATGGNEADSTSLAPGAYTTGAQSWSGSGTFGSTNIPLSGSANSGSGGSFNIVEPGTAVDTTVTLSGDTGGENLSVFGNTNTVTNLQPTIVMNYMIKAYN